MSRECPGQYTGHFAGFASDGKVPLRAGHCVSYGTQCPVGVGGPAINCTPVMTTMGLDNTPDIDALIRRDIGRRIRLHREAAGLTQWQLAYRLDTDQTTVSRWENGRVKPAGDHLRQLAEVFEVRWEALAYGMRYGNLASGEDK